MELAAHGDTLKGARKIAIAHIAKCLEGDISAIKELADRVDGKVPQEIANADGSDGPMLLVVNWGSRKANDDEAEVPLLELKAAKGE
jgi:hypothetical protein